MSKKDEAKGTFRFEKDTKRFHRFAVETEKGITGTVYIPKDVEPMPKTLILEYGGRSTEI